MQLLAALARCPLQWVEAEVLETLCLVIVNGGGGSADGWGTEQRGQAADDTGLAFASPRGGPWRLGSSSSSGSASRRAGAAPAPIGAGMSERRRGDGESVQGGDRGKRVETVKTPITPSQAYVGDWGPQELSVALSALARLMNAGLADVSADGAQDDNLHGLLSSAMGTAWAA